jgi:menaquinone-dependent protoporphyrinogen oxidase
VEGGLDDADLLPIATRQLAERALEVGLEAQLRRRRRTGCPVLRISRRSLRASADDAGDAQVDAADMPRVLVTYGSKHGSTAEIAHAIAQTFEEAGLSVDCIEAGEAETVEPYDAVVVGSAVYMRRWRGDATRFLRKHAVELAERPFWVFSSGPVGEPVEDESAARWLEPPKIIERIERLHARGHVVFGGRVPEHGLAGRSMAKNTPPEYRDRRDWDEIRAWAATIASELSAVPARSS